MSHWLPKVQTCVVLTKVFISWLMLWKKMPHKKLDFHSIQKGDFKASMLVWEEGVTEARNPGLVPRGLRKESTQGEKHTTQCRESEEKHPWVGIMPFEWHSVADEFTFLYLLRFGI